MNVTPWSRVFTCEILLLVKKFPAFYVHYRVFKRHVPNVRQIDPINVLLPRFFNIVSNSIPSTPSSSKWSLSSKFPHQTLYVFFFPIHAIRPKDLVLLDLIILVWITIFKCLIMQFSLIS